MRIYLASSWRNPKQVDVLELLRSWGHEVYDFKNPKPGNTGFHWSEIDGSWQRWTPSLFRRGLATPIAEQGFAADFGAMRWADACVMLAPCGRSAHIEAGWFVGANKPLAIYLPEETRGIEPELMWKLATAICLDPVELRRFLEKGQMP